MSGGGVSTRSKAAMEQAAREGLVIIMKGRKAAGMLRCMGIMASHPDAFDLRSPEEQAACNARFEAQIQAMKQVEQSVKDFFGADYESTLENAEAEIRGQEWEQEALDYGSEGTSGWGSASDCDDEK